MSAWTITSHQAGFLWNKMKQDISLTKLPFQVMSWCCKSSIIICISNFCGTLIQMPNGDKVPSWSSQHQSFRFKTLFRGFSNLMKLSLVFWMLHPFCLPGSEKIVLEIIKNLSRQLSFGGANVWCCWYTVFWNIGKYYEGRTTFFGILSGLDVVVAVLAEQHVAKLFVSLPKWQESMPLHKFRIQCSNAYNFRLPGSW